ncbi:unnamed protein product [Arctogadus glacialis]
MWQASDEDEETSVQDLSRSFGEMEGDLADEDFVPLCDSTPSSPGSGSASVSDPGKLHHQWMGRKKVAS